MTTKFLVYEISDDYKVIYIKLWLQSNRLDKSTDITNIAYLITFIWNVFTDLDILEQFLGLVQFETQQ